MPKPHHTPPAGPTPAATRSTRAGSSPAAPAPHPPASSGHRSGAVARMLRMPVATLRVWERRYAVTQPALSPSGQRLYSGDDVRRLGLIKQLTDLGHAIGQLAALDMAQLQQVAATHANVLAGARQGLAAPEPPTTPPPAWRVAVIGPALGSRLRRPALRRRLGAGVQWLGPFDDLAQAAASLPAQAVDALLIHAPRLQADWLATCDAEAPAWAELPKAVLYGFAAEAVCEALAQRGVALLREPQPDAVLAQWLGGVRVPAPPRSLSAAAPFDTALAGQAPVPPRRWDDAALADFAGLSSTVACECPRHVAELLVQLSQFEAYSAECAHRSPADAALHHSLRRVAGRARAQFETALENVAQHEGLLLPASR
jgi:DNA-binding transcriptional MerR regulator